MDTFLERLAEYHIQNHLTEINDFCFVFPSRRSGLFFAKQLGLKAPHPVWAPKIITINEFFREQHPVIVSDNISLLFRLHVDYQRIMNSEISIDEFLPLGAMLLSDFNDIDNYMVNAREVFSNLAALKFLDDDFSHLSKEQIEAIQSFWRSFDPAKLSEQQESFLAVWEKLYDLYESFRNGLASDGEAYGGMVFRQVAESVQIDRALIVPYKKLVFAGFNALTVCEKVVFHYLNLQGKATFYWDYPQWILEQPFSVDGRPSNVQHEATRFIKENLINYPSPRDWLSVFNEKLPEIRIASASNDLVQSRIAHDFLKEVSQEGINEQTALVLADEQQLLPVLHSIPEEYGAVNITLGFPLKNTPAYALLENLLSMQKTTRKTREGKTWFYHKNVLALLRHQYMAAILEHENLDLAQQLIASKQLFIEGSQLTGTPLLQTVFRKVDSTSGLEVWLSDLLALIYLKLEEKEDTQVEREFIYHLYTVIKRLTDILSNLSQQPSPETWLSLFRGIALQQSVPFKGEPLSGLQIMGILESRVLDFKNLVIIGLNEGTFPKTSPPDTFIPFNLRKGYGLPTIDNQDSIFAYYFYRLIHRAERVKLVYTTTKSATEEGEMSRFLQQLYYEYPGEVIMETMLQKVSVPVTPEIKALKNEEVMDNILRWTKPDGAFLSPSAISMYLECPMKFYYRYVAGIREPEEIIEDMDPRVFGNLFHEAVEILYRPFVGKMVNAADVASISENPQLIRDTLDEVFIRNVPFIKQKSQVFNDLQGKNSLIYEILFKYLVRFLKCETLSAPFKLHSLEEKVKGNFRLSNGLTVYIGGTIDRTDEKDGKLRIVDYKTGAANKQISELEHLFIQDKHSDVKAIFQTLLYAFIKSQSENDREIWPGVISLKEIFKGNYSTDIRLKNKVVDEIISLGLVKEDFLSGLDTALTELFDKNIPFIQTTHEKSCEYCIYSDNCLKKQN